MQLCEFHIHARGPEAERKQLAEWLRSLPRSECSNATTPVAVSLDAALAAIRQTDEFPRQTYFWTYSHDFFQERAVELVVYGELRDMPPLLFLQAVYQRFPELTLDCFSVLEHERHEHWRIGPASTQGELIEELVVNIQTDECERHFLKPGETSAFGRGSEAGDKRSTS